MLNSLNSAFIPPPVLNATQDLKKTPVPLSPIQTVKIADNHFTPPLKRSASLNSFPDSSTRKKKHKESHFPRLILLKPTALEDAFCITMEEQNKAKGQFNESDLIEHAHLRIQMFAIMSVILHGVGLRSDHSKRAIEIDIGKAYLQVGQGSNKYHAAHCNANAGYVDNIRKVFIDELNKENYITPKKKRILQIKGFTNDELRLLESNCSNLETTYQIFDRVWPIRKKQPPSLLNSTRIDFKLNSTTELPQSINLGCDKALETIIRPIALELYTRLMFNQITPQKACEEYCQLIVAHFEKMDIYYTERIAKIENYLQKIQTELQNFPISNASEALERLKEMQKSLVEINHLEEGKQKVISRAKIKENENFLKRSIYHLTNDEGYLSYLNKFLISSFDKLKNEVSHQLKRFEEYRIFCQLEKNGSVVPDFTTLFGTFDSETGKRVLEDDDFTTLQEKLLKQRTPQKNQPLSSGSDLSPVRQTLNFETCYS